MIEIVHNEVKLGVERTPLTELMSAVDKEVTFKAVINKDLIVLFTALIRKYDISTTATLIQRAIETAQELADSADFDIRDSEEEDGNI